jgi:hypothetical protein
VVITDGKIARLDNDYEWLLGTKAHTADLPDPHPVARPFNFVPESFEDGHRPGGASAGSCPHQYMRDSFGIGRKILFLREFEARAAFHRRPV